MNALKHYRSQLSVRGRSDAKQKGLRTKASAVSLPPDEAVADDTASPTSMGHSGAITSGNSSSAASFSHPEGQPTFSPPASTSEYQWRYQSARKIWYRNVDSMANFVLHWQRRFHEHGDMFATCTINVQPSSSEAGAAVPCDLSKAQLREAVRRLRHDHPTIALRLARRAQEGIEPLTNIPKIVAKNVDLQVALVYDVVETEDEVERWLDDVVLVHDKEERSEQGEFKDFIARSTADGVPGRDRFRIHYWPAKGGVDARVLIEQCHSVSEGIGLLLVFDLLLASVSSVLHNSAPAKLEWGTEVTRLEPALQDAIADPPATWQVSPVEIKKVEKINADRMNGKASAPNAIDKIGTKVVAMTLEGHNSKNKVRSKVVNRPLVKLCRSVAETGDMLPLGVLPQTGIPFTGEVTHTDLISETLTPDQTKALLAVLKKRGMTLAPFMEACSCMATMWVRKQRGLVPRGQAKKYGGYDDPNRILGSFSNAISKRDTLDPKYARYLGLCMSGFPTKVAAGSATFSPSSDASTGTTDALPSINATDLTTLFSLSAELASQYKSGRDNPDWLRHDQALLFNTMTTEYLFLRDAAHYPSMPWLSSIGRIDPIFRPSHAIEERATLEAHNLECVGRVGIRQPILHVYSFRMQTTIQFSFADWLYNPTDNANKESENILAFWLKVFRSLIDATLQAE